MQPVAVPQSTPESFVKRLCARCTEGIIDLAFVVDGSGSICEDDNLPPECTNWNLVLGFIDSIVQSLLIGEDETRVALLVFSTIAHVEFNLEAYFNKNVIRQEVRNLVYPGDSTNTYEGIVRMRQDIFNGMNGDRDEARDVAIVITDGVPTHNEALTLTEAAAAQAEGIFMISVGVGDSGNGYILSELSSPPRRSGYEYHWARDFVGLQNVRDVLLSVACSTQ